MSNTPNIGLELLAENQADKFIRHNLAMIKLDALTPIFAFAGFEVGNPPTPADGDRYINSTDDLPRMYLDGSGWQIYEPYPGMIAYDTTTGVYYYTDGTDWVRLPLNEIDFLTVAGNTTLTSVNNGQTAYITANADITLPIWANVPAGYAIEGLGDGGAHTVSLLLQVSDTVRGGLTSVTGDFAVVRSPTTGQWIALGSVTTP